MVTRNRSRLVKSFIRVAASFFRARTEGAGSMNKFQVGQFIEVIDPSISPYPMSGEILELDTQPLEYGLARIRTEVWVNLRLAKVKP
jgi:hypothetical protein